MKPKLWDTEPDNKSFKYRNVKCRIKRNLKYGFLSGYVAIPKGHILYGTDRFLLRNIFDIHGGITYGQVENDDKLYWMGFNCNHLGDKAPFAFRGSLLDDGVYRQWDYVDAQVRKLVDELLSKYPNETINYQGAL